MLVVKTQPVTANPPPRPRLADLRPVNENLTASYPTRSSESHQRAPLEPLFHIATEAQAAAQPMSIDSAADLHSTETHTVNGNGHLPEHDPATSISPMQHSSPDVAVQVEDAGAVKPGNHSPSRIEDASQVSPQAICLCRLAELRNNAACVTQQLPFTCCICFCDCEGCTCLHVKGLCAASKFGD